MLSFVKDQDQIIALGVQDVMDAAKHKHALVLGVLSVCKRWTRDEYPKKRLEAEALMASYTKAFELMLDYRTPLRLARMGDLRDKDKSVRPAILAQGFAEAQALASCPHFVARLA
jgi:hypothetical protein